MEKTECTPYFLNLLFDMLVDAPDDQVDPTIKLEIKEFIKEPHTNLEKFEYIVGISELPTEKICSFVVALCQLEKFYTKPRN